MMRMITVRWEMIKEGSIEDKEVVDPLVLLLGDVEDQSPERGHVQELARARVEDKAGLSPDMSRMKLKIFRELP